MFSIITLFVLWTSDTPVFAQATPDDHAQHHHAPPATPVRPPDATQNGGMAAGMGDMMKQMGTPAPKELIPR